MPNKVWIMTVVIANLNVFIPNMTAFVPSLALFVPKKTVCPHYKCLLLQYDHLLQQSLKELQDKYVRIYLKQETTNAIIIFQFFFCVFFSSEVCLNFEGQRETLRLIPKKSCFDVALTLSTSLPPVLFEHLQRTFCCS